MWDDVRAAMIAFLPPNRATAAAAAGPQVGGMHMQRRARPATGPGMRASGAMTHPMTHPMGGAPVGLWGLLLAAMVSMGSTGLSSTNITRVMVCFARFNPIRPAVFAGSRGLRAVGTV